MKMRKMILTGICAALLVAGAAYAQPHGHGMAGMEAHIAAALNLTDAQKAQVATLHQQMKAQMAPLMQQSRQQRAELKTLMNGVNPDATEIGQKTMAANATKAQMKAIHDDFKTKFTALLTPDQKAKFAQMQQSHMHRGAGAPAAPPADN
jgi:Spy/CpxP family protein refolding chaperone